MENRIRFFNTLTRNVELFVPNEDGKVKMYTCGPTVYHYAHIGNLRSYIMEDILEKTLRYVGYDVKRVMNITDVGHLSSDADTGEDKMLKGAKREHKTVMEIAKFYTDAFLSDCNKLNIRIPDVVEPATNCIPEFINMVSVLLEKGYAYIAGENVYFDTSKLKDYYVFSSQSEKELMVGVRDDVSEDTNKKNKADFVLWFTKSKFDNQELKWDSPWGVGYPGWHIECSCIAIKHLGEYVDIHCGGIGNAFPHHTNEIAQSEAILGHEWCKHWMHVLHLQTKDGKMSKSKGEFLTLDLLNKKGYSCNDYRFFCLQSHYRKPQLFSYDILDNCVTAYKKLVARISKLKDEGEINNEQFAMYKEKFSNCINNDLNTSLAITTIYDLLKDQNVNDKTKRELIKDFDFVLSLDLLNQEQKEIAITISDEEINHLIEERMEAKKNKDYKKADEIRNDLLSNNVKLIDTPNGTIFERC
ncbi:MAG: cysteine--tRNA ligase [Firmicutes bacterium]|nr:cysteine--tRNA ligase [Bacillota bacterium]